MLFMEKVIEVKNLVAGYGKKPILNNINFQANRGEMIGIIGANGSGKSTLLKSIRGFLPTLEGEILIKNQSTVDYSEKDFAKEVAYLQQNINISFDYTAKEIVMVGRYPHMKWWGSEKQTDESIVAHCMDFTGVSSLSKLPVNQISGGQRQRVLLAKVLAQQTPLLLLDEPTTGLDLVYQEDILRFCKTLCDAGKTIVAVLHEVSLAAKYCSKFVLIGGGKIIKQGTSEEVITESNLSKAYEMPIKVIKNPLSGHFELCADFDNENSERQNKLINIICPCAH